MMDVILVPILVSNWEQCLIHTKNSQILYRKKVSMLTGLLMSSLAFKCAFYGPAHNTKGGPHGTDVCSS